MRAAEDLMIRVEDGERAAERAAIRHDQRGGFGGTEEADLVARLRAEKSALLSLVAQMQSQLVGHVLFSRMSIEAEGGLIDAVALAPVAVLPEYQRVGVGGRLIRKGLEMLRARGEKIVIVVGHPDYYPLFGFPLRRPPRSTARSRLEHSWRSNLSPAPSPAFAAGSYTRRH